MKKDIKNLDLLFSDNDKEIYKGIIEKKDWINTKLILNGSLDYYMDEKGNKRYFYLENLVDNVVAFHSVVYLNAKLGIERQLSISTQLEPFKRVVFKRNINLNDDAPFYIEYDFNKLDSLAYKTLVANFYYMHDENELEINLDNVTLDPKDLIKICLIGSEDEACLILGEENLLKGVLYLPIVSKIYIAKPLDKELFESLKSFADDNDVTMEVIYEDRKDLTC